MKVIFRYFELAPLKSIRNLPTCQVFLELSPESKYYFAGFILALG